MHKVANLKVGSAPQITTKLIRNIFNNANAFLLAGKDRYSTEADVITTTVTDSNMKVSSRTNSFEIENLLKTAEQVTGFCRSPIETRKSSPTGSVVSNTSQTLLTPSRQLSDAEKLRKVVMELVDTERTYVKVSVNC